MKNIRSFLLTLTLVTIATTPLSAMKSQCMDVETIAPEHETLIPLLHVYATLKNELPQEIVNYIFSYYQHVSPLVDDFVDDIIQNCDQPYKLMSAIERLCKTCYSDLSAKILAMALQKAGVSLCDIKCGIGSTTLHYAANRGYTEIVKVLLATAGDKAWKLICITGSGGCTALHCAAVYFDRTEVVKILLAAAGDKAWEFICMKNNNGYTALDFANNQIKQIMVQYRPNNQQLLIITESNS